MRCIKFFRQSILELCALPSILLISVFLSMILFTVEKTAFAQIEKESEYKITLKSRSFTPQPGIKQSFRESLMIQLERGEERHVYVQMKRQLSVKEREKMEKQGIKLLAYIGSFTWYATLTDRLVLEFTSLDVVRRTPILGTLRWIGQIRSEDKIEPKILIKGVGDYNRQPDGRVYVIVVFFPDVPIESSSVIVGRYGEMLRKPGMLNDIVVRLKETKIRCLSQEDTVKWIEEVGPPDKDHNDGASTTAGINPLWAAPYNLDGTNVQVGQWESRNPENTHGDLTGRVTVIENEGVSDHATHVAGILAGDGNLSAGAGGAANQWRGVADQVDIFSYSTRVDNLEPEENNGAINTYGIDISTNSWGSGGNDYRTRSAKYDQVVRGIYGRAIPVVFSASNSNHTYNSVTQPGGTAKNIIVVGNINSDDNTISIKSSWGPTDEGQTKPDIVAPGDETGGDGGINSCVANLFLDEHNNALIPDFGAGDLADGLDDYTYPYGIKTGTSMAAPLVSGVIALMLQQYRETYFGDDTRDEALLPSTFKAIICHTAVDLVDHPGGGADLVGPDFVYGYGLINAEEAVDAIWNKRFREGVILSVDDEDIYTFEVAPGEDELKVTIAWDDVAANPGDIPPNFIKNDLDLVLINPDGDEFYPPWELDPANPATPAVRNFYPTEADAEVHRDDVNVVEQVEVDNPDPGTWTIKVKVDDLPGDLLFPYQRYSIIAGDQPEHQLEGKVDIVQVLDRSGSMGGYTSSGSTERKIEVLRTAADQFIQMMKPDIGNQLGLVQFNQDLVPFDPAHDAGLSELSTNRAVLLSGTTVPSIDHGGRTSIGDGLNKALNQLTNPPANPDNDQVILLVTDGKENEPLWIDDVRDDLIAADIPIYPLGLGYGSGINEAKLTDLAEKTGGTYRITSDSLIFRKFFIEILAGAVDWSVITDPVGELTKGDSAIIPVIITADQRGATFTVYWEGISDAIDLELITPTGKVIMPTSHNNRIRYGEHPLYCFYQLNFPLMGNLAGEWAGEWKMKLIATDHIDEGKKVRYSTSAFAEGGVKLNIVFDRLSHLTGDKVLLKAKLTRDGLPVTGGTIKVFGNVPAVGVGNLLHDGKVSMTDLKKIQVINGDPISLIDRKLQILEEAAGEDIFQRRTADLVLYDDSLHGDDGANDGIYANSFIETRIPGSFTFRFVASNIPAGGGLKATREWTKSLYNEVNIDPDYSIILFKMLGITADGIKYNISVIPRDRFRNYLGPGHNVVVAFVISGSDRKIQLADNIDGTYTKEIFLTQNEIEAGAEVKICIDGKTFTTVLPPKYHKWSISFHLGSALPTGSFADDFDPGFNLLMDVDYHFSPQLSLIGLFGYNAFKSKTAGIDNTCWMNLSANLKYRLTTGALSPYFSGGPGYYIPKTGSSSFGFNLGIGLDYDYNNFVILELGADYHTILDEDIQFLHAHAGVIFRF